MALFKQTLPDIDLGVQLKPRKWAKQASVVPDTIRQRHVGEGIRFLRSGLAENRPLEETIEGAIYVATDTGVVSIWNGTQFVENTFS